LNGAHAHARLLLSVDDRRPGRAGARRRDGGADRAWHVLRFGPSAAKLYRRFAGQTVTVGCGRPSIDTEETLSSVGTDGTRRFEGGGYLSTKQRLPRRRGRVELRFIESPYDVCFIATKRRPSDDVCLPVSSLNDRGECVRVVVALTDQGLADVDERSRVIELGALFGEPLGRRGVQHQRPPVYRRQ